MVLLVRRTDDDGTEPAFHQFPAVRPHEGVVVFDRGFFQNGVTVRESEYDRIASLDVTETLEPSVLVVDQSGIGLLSEDDIVRERYGQRGLGDPGAVCQLAYEEMVSGIERTLHGG